jgi:RHS repeat-associated protein
MKRHLLAAAIIQTALLTFGFAQENPDPPPPCDCPTYVSVTPDAPEKDGIIKLTPTKEGMVVISVVATPPAQGAIQPTFRIRQENGKEVATASAWSHTFNLSTVGLESPLILETLVDCPNYGSSGKQICDTKRFSFGCETGACSSGSCQSGTGDVSGDVDPADANPFDLELPIGMSSQGDEKTSLYFSKSPTSPIAVADFKVRSNGGHTHSGNVITTGTTVTTISTGGGGVTIQIKRAGTNDVFRTYQFNSVTSGATKTLTLVETRCDQQPITHVWSANNGLFSFSAANGLRKITGTIEQNQNFVRIERHKTFELVSGNEVLVADTRLHYQTYLWGTRLVQRQIDPAGTNLTTTWTYGGPSDGLAYGKLKTLARHDGYTETHTYGTDFHQVDSPGNRQTKTIWTANSVTTETRTGGTLHGKEVRTYSNNNNTLTHKRHTAANSSLQTVTTYMPVGSDFGGLPATVTRPDGTVAKYTYARTGGNRVTTVEDGKFVSGTLTDGTVNVTTANAQGQTIESKTTDAPSNIVIAHTKALVLDNFGRPTTIGHFPNAQNVPVYSELRAYACCKLTSETDIHGVTTLSQFDLLGRRTHTQTHGVVRETVYKGLTRSSHRYASSGSAATTNLIAESITNLAGTIQESWEPDASSNSNGALVKTTTTTTYQPAVGLSRQVVTTVPGNHSQTTTYLLDGRIQKSTGALSPGMEYSFKYTSFGNLYAARAYLDGSTRREITVTRTDWLGRTTATGHLSTLTSTTLIDPTLHTYQSGTGLHLSTTDPDGVAMRYEHNARGERETTVLELNGNTATDYGVDQVTRTRTFAANSTATPTVPVIRTEVHVWQDGPVDPILGTVVPTLASYTERTPDGLKSWSWRIGGGVTSTVSTVGLNRTVTTTNPDGTTETQQYANGLLASVTSRDASGTVISSMTYAYATSIKRLQSVTDSRTGTTHITYRSFTADVQRTITDPGGRVTTFTYDNRGRRTQVDAPNSFDPAGPTGNTNLLNITVTAYKPDGTVTSVTGAQNYPVTYTYDYAHRMQTMTTSGTAGNVTTAWNYSTTTGQLLSKRYNSNIYDSTVPNSLPTGTTGTGPDYTYTPAGRLLTRDWARTLPSSSTRVRTTYGYTNGRLTGLTYNDGTPNLAYTRDNLGRLKTVTRAGNNHAEYLYDPTTLRLITEKLNQDAHERHLKRHYDSLGRPISLNLTNTNNTSQYTTGYSYDNAGRLQNVWHHPTLSGGVPQGSPTFTYGYAYDLLTTSPNLRTGAVGGAKQDFMPYTLTRNAAGADPALTATRTYEATRDVLRSIENKAGTTVVSSFTYGVNPITQRESVTTAFDLGLKPGGSASHTSNPGATAWQYDDLGQVIMADHAATANSDRAYDYDNIGNRTQTASGTLTLPTGNNWTANALNQYTAVSAHTPTNNPVHDADGNMTSGPVPGSNGAVPGSNGDVPFTQPPSTATAMQWDAENRLISFAEGANTISFAYDHLSRLVTRSYNGTVEARYHYDGWNRIAEYNSSGTTLRDTFTWGLDLSGTMQGAGGVGGLLATRWKSASGSPDYFPTYDGNGNVSEYLTTAGAVEVHYEYDPFGGLTHRSGNSGARFQYRFSTKPRIQNSGGLYYYAYRWYNTYTGSWPSRDPIEEEGGVNLYGFVLNVGVNRFDYLGLQIEDTALQGNPMVFPPKPAGNQSEYLNSNSTQVDKDVLSHASRVSALEDDPMTLESSRVGFTGYERELKDEIRAQAQALILRESTEAECCGGEMDIDQLVGGVQTKHIWSLGRINVQLKGRLVVEIKNNKAKFKFTGTYDPQTDRFNFSPFNQPNSSAAVVAGLGAIAQVVTFSGSFDINFTGPVAITIKGAAECPK